MEVLLTRCRNGQLKEYIAAGTNKEEFIRRLGGTSQQEASQGPPPPYSTAYTGLAAIPPQSPQATESQPSQGTDDLIDPTQPAVTATDSPASNQGNPQTEQPTEEEKRAAAAKKKGKARAEAEDEAQRRVNERCGCDPPNPEQAHANEIKLRKQQANEERKRILKRIEDDKKARKERDAAERRARALLSADPNADPDANAGSSTAHETPAVALRQRSGKQQKGNGGDYCNLQVRLLDGSTMRSRFPSDKTLSTDVRAWIDAERTDGNAAYGFRILLTPLPNKVVSPTEETKSLLKLGLAPSATLVLIPARYSLARGSYGDDLLSPVLAIFSSLYGAIMDSIGGIFGFLFGGGGGNAGRNRNDGGGSGSGDGDDVPMENLWARRRDAQLYNGNSVGSFFDFRSSRAGYDLFTIYPLFLFS